jgi:hypothetical protein
MPRSATSLHLVAAVALTNLALSMKTDAAPERILFDFSATNAVPGWQIVNDEVMGGVSQSAFTITNSVALFHGELSLENSGGFASIRSPSAPQRLHGLTAFVLRVRGDGKRYKLTVRTEAGLDSPLYQHAFSTKPGQWEEHRLEFKDFVPTFRGRVLAGAARLNPARANSVGLLISDKQQGPFRLEIAWIKASGRSRP